MNNYNQNNMNYNNGYNNGYNNMNYNNGYNKKPLSHYIKNFLLVLLGFILLIFILLWLFPTKAGIKDNLMEALNPLYDRIYQDNLNNMKEAAITYYTTERLPKTEGSSKTMTLGEMLDKKLLLAVKDKNGNMCDTKDSYVKITKDKKEYRMKVNLKCGEEEQYIIVYLGCYSYCDGDICEKKTSKKATVVKKVVKKVTPNKKHYCEIVNGKYYDSNGKVVKKSTYQRSCEHKPSPTPKYYCKIVNGKYYDAKGKVVSKKAYEKSCGKPEPTPKYYCKIVDGKYYDKKGNIVSKEEYKASCYPTPEKKYKYQYAKKVEIHHDKEYSKWTDWSDNIEYDPDHNTINWGQHEFEWNEKVGYKTITKYETDKTKPIWQTVNKQIGTYSQWACDEYDYFIDSTTTTTYITSGSNGGWTYAGTITSSKVPSSSNTVKYVFAGMSYSNCGSLCNVSPVYKFAKYTRTASVTTNTTSSTSSDLTAVCKHVVKKDIPVYANLDEIVGYGVKKTTEKIYYYHKKTRTLIKDEYDETKTYIAWSYSKEDEALIRDGYKYTGIYIVV